MMVKNEAQIIERCLKNIIQLQPELVVIVDTGSTDDTITRAGLFLQLHNIKFKIYQHEFINFGYNRSKVLQYVSMENDIDYVLMVDADERLKYSDDFNSNTFKNSLEAPIYQIRLTDGLISYFLTRLTSNKIKLNYVGVTHEYLDTENYEVLNNLDINLFQLNDSSRRKSNTKFVHDIQLLERALEEELTPNLRARYVFYLAQSYVATANHEKAIENYKLRVSLGGWKEEVFYSHYQIANTLILNKSDDIEKIVYHLLFAYQICPYRIESLYALRAFYLKKEMLDLANLLLPVLETIKHPQQGLFLEDYKYYVYS